LRVNKHVTVYSLAMLQLLDYIFIYIDNVVYDLE